MAGNVREIVYDRKKHAERLLDAIQAAEPPAARTFHCTSSASG